MKKIGLFYGSSNGATEEIAKRIQNALGLESVDIHDIYNSSIETIQQYNSLIFGVSTCHDGQLQNDWANAWMEIKKLDFEGKKIALFGLGDQHIYNEWFADAMGIIAHPILNNGGEIIGEWSTDGYEFSSSKAELVPGNFIGLPIDRENQDELTNQRIDNWSAQLLLEFTMEANNSKEKVAV